MSSNVDMWRKLNATERPACTVVNDEGSLGLSAPIPATDEQKLCSPETPKVTRGFDSSTISVGSASW